MTRSSIYLFTYLFVVYLMTIYVIQIIDVYSVEWLEQSVIITGKHVKGSDHGLI
jgi:hypothetical protein